MTLHSKIRKTTGKKFLRMKGIELNFGSVVYGSLTMKAI